MVRLVGGAGDYTAEFGSHDVVVALVESFFAGLSSGLFFNKGNTHKTHFRRSTYLHIFEPQWPWRHLVIGKGLCP
jgi:hypothetical protein